tara:strand:- start:670 stop:1098 length:429 start_codon:yes stop_codon:yes gene_type:complete
MNETYIIINGGTQKQRWLAEDITFWFCNKFFKRFKSYNIEIDLDNMDGDVQGWCMEIDKNASHIQLNKKLKGDDFITCLLHELVHVRQQFKGYLKDIDSVQKMWKGEAYFCIDYYNLPWEKEAYEQQEVLLNEYRNESIRAA